MLGALLSVLVGSAAAAWPSFDADLLASLDRHAIQVPKTGGSSLRNALKVSRCEAWDRNGRRDGDASRGCAANCAEYLDRPETRSRRKRTFATVGNVTDRTCALSGERGSRAE